MNTHTRPHRLSVVLAALLWLVWAAPARAGLETILEKFVGRQAASILSDEFGTESDPALHDWVRRIGERVSAASPRQEVKYRFQIIEMDEPNALALPGGYIFVTKGLLEFVQDDDELAAIIAHEVGHVAGRHAVRQVEQQLLMSILLSSIPERNRLVGTAAGLMDALLALGRSRADELDADRRGAEYAARSGYDPEGLLVFFQQIQRPKKPSWVATLFATHPPPTTRSERLKETPFLKEPNPETLIAIGDRLADEYRFSKALTKYRQAERLRPGDSATASRITAALAAQGRAQAALAPATVTEPAQPAGPAGRPAAAEAREIERARQAVAAVSRDQQVRRRQMNETHREMYRSLEKVWGRHRWTKRLQSTLLLGPQGLDYRWMYIAGRSMAVAQEIDRLLDRVGRISRLAPEAMGQVSAHCLLATQDSELSRALPPELLSDLAAEMERAGKESLNSVAEAQRLLPELAEADRLVAGVLTDLNSPYVLNWPNHWGHIAVLEGFLRVAEARVRSADARARKAARDAACARARVERAGLDLAACVAPPAEHAVFCGQVRRRLHASDEELTQLLARGHSLGDAAVMLLYSRSTAQPVLALEAAHRENDTWIETAERLGLSVDVQAIILRLLRRTFDEERIRA